MPYRKHHARNATPPGAGLHFTGMGQAIAVVGLLLYPFLLAFSSLLEWFGYGPQVLEARPVLLGLVPALLAGAMGLRITRTNLLTAAPSLLLAAAYLVAWIAPATLGANNVTYLYWLVFVELLAQSFAALWARALSSRTADDVLRIGFPAVVLVAVTASVSSAVGHWWPMAAVLLAGGNQFFRFLSGRFGQRETETRRARWLRWSWGLLIVYLFCFHGIWSGAGGVRLPRFGWEQFRVRGLDFVWSEAPYRAMALGFLYYLTIGCLELTHHPRPLRQPEGQETARP